VTENETPQESAAEETPSAAEETPKEEVTAEAEAPVQTDQEDKEPPIAYELKETKSEAGSVQRYCVEVQADVLDGKMNDILAELNKTVVVDGFRRGKAPMRLLRTRYGKDAEKDALGGIGEDIAGQIIEKDEIEPIGDPSLNDSKVEEGKPIQLEIDIEVRPKIDPVGYTDGEFEIEAAEVTDEIIDGQLEEIRQANATFEAIEDKSIGFAEGNGATLDIQVEDRDGKPMESLCDENVFLPDPSRALMPEVVKDLEGKKPGETFESFVERTVTTRDDKKEKHKDKYTITVREVKARVIPELDDEFAKDVGDFETLADLRARIENDLKEQADQRKRRAAMDAIFGKMIEGNPFDAPKSIVAAQEYQTIMRDSQQMQSMGIDLDAMGQTTQGYLASAHDNAERFVKMNLLLNAISVKEKLEVSDEDVDKEIERMAEAEGRKPLAIRARLEAEKKLDNMKRDLIVGKVEDFLMEKNTLKVVAPKPPEEVAKKKVAKKKPAAKKPAAKKAPAKKTPAKKKDEE
jgi:trigger factor